MSRTRPRIPPPAPGAREVCAAFRYGAIVVLLALTWWYGAAIAESFITARCWSAGGVWSDEFRICECANYGGQWKGARCIRP